MNCRSCRALIADLAGGELPADQTDDVRRHAAACPACRLELALAGRIHQGLSRLATALPPADFTARVLAALPAPRPAALPFWPQALSMSACAVSTLAVVYGLLQHLPEVGRIWRAGEAWNAEVVAGPGLALAAAEPGRAYAFLVSVQAWAADAVTSLAGYLRLLSWLYHRTGPGLSLAVLGAALLWILYDYSQRARA